MNAPPQPRPLTIDLASEADTERLGAALGDCLEPGSVVYLSGDLGAGKTTLVRGLLRARGYRGPVKSPTYTLLESYRLADLSLVHCDLYRIHDPGELEFLALQDADLDTGVLLVEWPERGEPQLPPADYQLLLEYTTTARICRITSRLAGATAALEERFFRLGK